MNNQFEKHFTLEEAQALIPSIQKVFKLAHELAGRNDTDTALQRPTNGNGNGHGKGSADSIRHWARDLSSNQKQTAFAELLNSIYLQGIVIQDPWRGLIDFPSIRDGQEVFLCYELADGDTISTYHELNAGYAGRKPL